ncbi:adenylate/guanylate cyclase domain-containing protein [Nocardioides astragali]|uniref:Adenylate/guanylate cyclase domain-containing protein n=1 Tax=Nocardioides astragali TaxID=1776736 RepID=A0ABW2MY66_9ACTN|nr:response regulator [Nocardioides astragali]
MTETLVILAVDDEPLNLRLLEAVLAPHGHRVLLAATGEECLDVLAHDDVDLVLLDVVMPGIDGYEVCRRIRADARTAYLPIVMLTASDAEQRVAALEAGADDFVRKPFDRSELLARVESLGRIKRYHDTISVQRAELETMNRELEERVAAQVAELDRMSRLRRFLSPQLAEVVMGDESLLASHRRQVVVVFCDLRNFTTFAETSEPEEVMDLLGEYHRLLGSIIDAHDGTLERFTGDGVMVFFNDPFPCRDPADRAVRMALEINERVRECANRWRRLGFDLALGTGIAQGYATLGRIGYEGRYDYAAIGSVTNQAARLCDVAEPWQVLVPERLVASCEGRLQTSRVGTRQFKGFTREVEVHAVEALVGSAGEENAEPAPEGR